MHRFQVSGLLVESEIELPQLISAPSQGAPAQVTILFGGVPISLPGSTEHGPTWQIAGDRFLIRIPGVARFLLVAGRTIIIEAEDNTPRCDIAIFVTGTVFGILLHQRHQVVLHASAVRVGDGAVMFCGASGAGKSTIAAALGQRGYPLLNDDVCAIGLDPAGAPIVHSDGRQLKLWAQAIDQLDLLDQRGSAVRSQLQKFYVQPHHASEDSLTLNALYVLRETRPPYQDGIERPNALDATLLVRRNAYRPRLVSVLQQSAQYFQSAATIAAKAGVFFLTRPLNFAAMPLVLGRLEQHWRDLDMIGAEP